MQQGQYPPEIICSSSSLKILNPQLGPGEQNGSKELGGSMRKIALFILSLWTTTNLFVATSEAADVYRLGSFAEYDCGNFGKKRSEITNISENGTMTLIDSELASGRKTTSYLDQNEANENLQSLRENFEGSCISNNGSSITLETKKLGPFNACQFTFPGNFGAVALGLVPFGILQITSNAEQSICELSAFGW